MELELKKCHKNKMIWIVLGSILVIILGLLLKRKKCSKGKKLKKYRLDSKFEIKISTGNLKNLKKNKKKFVGVFEFDGDLKASARKSLSCFVDEIVFNRELIQEVVIKVESPGGSVSHYGHCMSEMERLRNAGISITVCVDTIAASGGYLMSLPAQKILAAPYAMIGSIGVMSFVPNIRKLLKKLDINPRTFTAGKFKRTVTLTDEAGPEEISHYQNKLEDIHHSFSSVVTKYRKDIIPDQVCTGDYWLAEETIAKDLKLIDGIQTSGQYLQDLNQNYHLVCLKEKKDWKANLRKSIGMRLSQVLFGDDYLFM